MRKLAIFSAAFALAAAVYVYLFRDVRALWLAGACLALSALGRWRSWRRVSVAGLGVAVGLLWCFVWQAIQLSPAEGVYGTELPVTVKLTDTPIESRYGTTILGTVKINGRTYEAALFGDAELLELGLQPGDGLSCTARVEPSGLEIEDGDSLYYRSRGVALYLYVRSEPTVTKGLPNIPQRLRLWLQDRIHVLYRGGAAGLVRALLTGDRSELDYTAQNDLSVAGLSHAVAVSGMHVSMLLAMAAFFCGGNPRLLALIGIPIVLLFALMTGASPSVCRAAVMQILLLCAPLARRENDGLTTLGVAALLLLLENPWSIASVSFQLSFAAVAGLFLLSAPIQKKLLSLRKKPGQLLRFVASAVSATLSATALTLPLTVYYFGLVSLAAPLTNLLALWAVTGVFTLGLLSCCLGPVGTVLAWIATLLSNYVLGLCAWIAAVPFAAAYPQNLPLMVWAFAAYGLALWLLLCKRHPPVSWSLSLLTAAFLACILAGHWQFRQDEHRFTVLDVGQGQCLLFQAEDFTALIDCGGSDPEGAGEQAARLLHSAGVTRVDALILTHYDADHCGGAAHFLNRVRVDSLFFPDTADESGIRETLENADGEKFPVRDVVNIGFSGGEITLYPPVLKENDNNGGVCVLASAAEYDILVTGDLDRFAEMRLLSRYALPEVDLLVAGHHGSRDSTSQILLDTVRPETVVISVGENTYGHPAAETLQRIETTGAEILRTDELGTITIVP